MTPERFKELIELAGYETRSYSGRGMYGEECIAVKSFNPMKLALDVIEMTAIGEERNDLRGLISNYREDALGLGNIIYFPSMPYPEDQDET